MVFWRSERGLEPAKAGPVPAQGESLELKLAAVKARFLTRLRNDRAVLAQLREHRLAPGPDIAASVHKLAGSAGMVGFAEISEAAGRLEDELLEEKPNIGSALSELLALIDKTLAGVDPA